MDVNSPEKSTGGFNMEYGATLSDKTDLNAYGNKEGFEVGSLNYKNEVAHDERKGYLNLGYTSPSMPLVEVNDGSRSPSVPPNSLGSSFPVIKPEEMTGAIDADPGISSVQGETLDYGIEGERYHIKAHQKDVLQADIDSGSTVLNFTKSLSCHLNNPLDKGDNDHYISMVRGHTEMHNGKMSCPDVVNVDCGLLHVNSQPEKVEDNEERDNESLSLKSSHEFKVREGCYSDTVPPENVGMVWEHSSLQSPQETQNISTSERRLSVSAERSPHKQSPSKSPTVPKKEISSPANFDNEQVPSPQTSRRRYSPSPEKHRSGRDRASSRDRSPPSMSKKSPSNPPSKREAHHRDDSPKRHFSRSPRKHESARRTGRSASKSPMRRYSPRHRRNHQHSRSRSPIARDYNRRSPRKHSPRRRSPFYPSGRHSPRRQWSPPANRNTGIGKPGRNLYVAGFSYGTTERDLERKFSKFGRVTDVRVVRERRSGDSRGFGFLSLERDEDADAAIRDVDQTEWNGRIILVEKSKSSSRRS